MGETRRGVAGVAVILAFMSTGCMQLVRQWELDAIMEPVHGQLADHETRISANASAMESFQNSIDELRGRLDQLQREFGGHVGDDDMHGGGLAVSLPVHFDFNSSDIRAVDRPILDAFAAAIAGSYPQARITVEGSSDQAGSGAYNMRLSTARAESVRDYLVQNGGLDADNVGAVGMGESRLVNEETGVQNPQSGIENRRATFIIEWAGPGSS
ncbi:OmpA family protein [Candidatus Palauibacter sp.]|uniref:OmpA family protein n=1 Tax=Candidatus Palauibacter sp. TaxID=3101350 RepID=UPI003B020BEB